MHYCIPIYKCVNHASQADSWIQNFSIWLYPDVA